LPGLKKETARRVAEAVYFFGITVASKTLRKRSHRSPSIKKVSLYFRVLIKNSYFTEFVCNEILFCLRNLESSLGKPNKEWSIEERHKSLDCIENHFHILSKSYNPPRGRPRSQRARPKIKNCGGIINNAQRDGAIKRRRQKRKEQESLVKLFLSGYAEGAFARKEKKQYLKEGYSVEFVDDKIGTLNAWRHFKKEVGIDTFRCRLPSGTVDRFLKQKGIDPKHKVAFKMRISRARRPSS